MARPIAIITRLEPASARSHHSQPGITGSAAATVAESMQGAALYIDHINAKGGVGGQKVEVLSLDDKFDPKLTLDNTRTLIEQKGVIGLFMTRGTPHTQGIIPVLEQHGVPLVGPSTGAIALHQPVSKYVFNVRAPYPREVTKAISHLHTLGVQRIGVGCRIARGRDNNKNSPCFQFLRQGGLQVVSCYCHTADKQRRAKGDYHRHR